MVRSEPATNTLGVTPRNPRPTLQALIYSYQSQVGTSALAEVPSSPCPTLRGRLFLLEMDRLYDDPRSPEGSSENADGRLRHCFGREVSQGREGGDDAKRWHSTSPSNPVLPSPWKGHGG